METLSVALPTLLSFALASTLIELTPGPNMTYLALVSASEGRRVGFATVARIALGLAVIGLAAALGVAELINASPLAYETRGGPGWPSCSTSPGTDGAASATWWRRMRGSAGGISCAG